MTFTTGIVVVPTSVAVGATVTIGGAQDHLGVTLGGTFVATVAIEVSMDGANWAPVASLTAPGTVNIPFAVRAIRANTTAFTNGTPVARYGCHMRA
jgi:hypothetical protein